MFVFLQSKLKYFPKIFIFEQGVLFVKLSFVNIMVRKIICSEISAITVYVRAKLRFILLSCFRQSKTISQFRFYKRAVAA